MSLRHLLFLDFETYYDSASYTLRKMTPAEYILDPRFETTIVAVTALSHASSVTLLSSTNTSRKFKPRRHS